jgi:FMN phosphatase YigB (HAD superfamily)
MSATVIFDVGNVILPFDPLTACRKLARLCEIPAVEIRDRIYDAKLERRFEEGKIDGGEFTSGVEEELGIRIGEERLREIWSDMFTENTRVVDLVLRLRKNGVSLMLLSNTNEWHWSHVLKEYPIISDITPHILSYRVGVLKPDPIIFRAALNQVDVDGPVIYTDDMQHNVSGANAVGLDGVLFKDVDDLRQALHSRGVPID